MPRPPNPTVVRDPNRPPPQPPRALTDAEKALKTKRAKIEAEINALEADRIAISKKQLALHKQLDRLAAEETLARMSEGQRRDLREILVGPGPDAGSKAGTPFAN
jgi:hypothetical protein